MKDLAGTVTTWLIYHVVDTDQKIVTGEAPAGEEKQFDQYADLFAHSALDMMETMAGLDQSSMQLQTIRSYQPQGDIFVTIQLVDDLKGKAVFVFSKELALHLLQTMTGMELTEVDELVQSALCELTNISCGNAATALTKRGLQCDIKPPVLSSEFSDENKGSGVRIDTAFGPHGNRRPAVMRGGWPRETLSTAADAVPASIMEQTARVCFLNTFQKKDETLTQGMEP